MAVKKSIAIIGEGETEWWYFETLRVACRYKFKVAPDFPQHSDIPHMAKLAEDYVKRETDYVVCLVDMDRLLRVPAEMATYQKLKKKSSRNVIWIETNPCTEFWFLLHFLPQLSMKHYDSCEDVLPDLQHYMPDYEKTARYFRKNNLYNYLTEHGDLQRAIGYAEELTRLSETTPVAWVSWGRTSPDAWPPVPAVHASSCRTPGRRWSAGSARSTCSYARAVLSSTALSLLFRPCQIPFLNT